ncbi:MAG: HAD family phosphatase [Clostridia bacterium]|nr:HAD family phosphatase [Clostridia bacterium]
MTAPRRAVFLDLDGTLLNSQKQITEENRSAIHAAVDEGHAIVLCSGRPLSCVMPLVEDLGIQSQCVICYNGGMIYDCSAKELLFQQPLPQDVVDTIFREADSFGLHAHTYDSAGLLVREMDPETEFYMQSTGISVKLRPELPRGLTEPPVKCIVMNLTDRPVLEAYRARLESVLSDSVELFFSNPVLLEIVSKGVSKGTAIRILCRHLGIPPERTIGAGDSENDLPMLETTALSCCMANGTDACKNASNYITEHDCDHSGVAEIIRKFVLIP